MSKTTTQKAIRIDDDELKRATRVRLLFKRLFQTEMNEADVLRNAITLGLDELLKRLSGGDRP